MAAWQHRAGNGSIDIVLQSSKHGLVGILEPGAFLHMLEDLWVCCYDRRLNRVLIVLHYID